MDVEIISIGNEVLSGDTLNRNAAFLSRALSEKGYNISRQTVLGDRIEEIRLALKEAMGRSTFCIATGGLGPTLDDVTKTAALHLMEKPIELKNSLGTAEGFFGSNLFLLPGVPREMERMFEEEVLPFLAKYFPQEHKIYCKRVTLALLREVEVDPILRKLQEPGLEIGIYPSYGSLQIVFKSSHPVDGLLKKVQEAFPTFFIGEGSVEEAVHREFIKRKKKLALAESCTGGAIAALLTAIPDASLFFSGSLVAYSNGWKERFLGVRHDTLRKEGSVSAQAVIEMIQGLFSETECDYAIAVSGILGPSGETSQKTIGTVFIGVGKRGEKIDVGKVMAPKDRQAGITFTAKQALGALWRHLVHNTPTFS